MTVVCLDLDRTVIYSPAALELRMPDADAPRLLCVEIYRGAPLSFLTEAAVDALRALQELATVVPTTTRTPEQLARVRLPGRPARFAIAANGGHLLVDGVPDAGWAATVRTRLAECAPLDEVEARLGAHGGPFVRSLRRAALLHKVPYYTTVAGASAAARGIEAWLAGEAGVRSLQEYFA